MTITSLGKIRSLRNASLREKSAADTTGHITHRITGTLEQVSHNPPPFVA